jgi:hypothetical protein
MQLSLLDQVKALARKPDEIRVIGPLPSSIAYLHSLIANGSGDAYDWENNEFTIQICGADATREPTLGKVQTVTFVYTKSK